MHALSLLSLHLFRLGGNKTYTMLSIEQEQAGKNHVIL
jgi:hypothetical protein